jgi:hypothetical protein
MTTKPVLGISGCLTGSAVRFDGGHKRMGFVMDELAQWVSFRPVCPEMAIGLPTPRPALRLIQTDSGETQMRFSKPLTMTSRRKWPTLRQVICQNRRSRRIYRLCEIPKLRHGARAAV